MERKKIAIFSPIPPLRSGISDYMIQILPELCRVYDVHIYIDSGYHPDNINKINFERIQFFNHQFFEKNLQEYDNLIFQLGNNEQHYYMVPYIEKYKGIIILHDYNIHGMARSLSLGINKNKSQYIKYLKEEFGDLSIMMERDIDRGLYKNAVLELEVNKYFLINSRAVIVHNDFAKRALIKKGIKNVHQVKIPVNLPKVSSQNFNSHFVYASFGFINQNKRIDVVIRCIKRLIDYGCSNINYIVVGHENDSNYVKDLKLMVSKLKLNDVVIFTNYVSSDEYTRLLHTSDVCIHLRYPTVGESSGATLNALSYGKPVIVSNADAFKEYPDDVVFKIPVDKNEEEVLFERMLEVYNNAKLRKSMGEKARNYISQNHSMELYGQRIREIIDNSITIDPKLTIVRKLKTILKLENEEFINKVFEEFLNRKPQKIELNQYHRLIIRGGIRKRLAVIARLINTSESIELYSQPLDKFSLKDNSSIANILRTFFIKSNNKDFIRELYTQILLRNPDELGLNHHLNYLNQRDNRILLLKEILLSEEAFKIMNE